MDTLRHLSRRPLTLLLGAILLTLGTISAWWLVQFRAELSAQAVRELEEQVADRVASWEQRLLEQLNQWLDLASVDPGSARQVQDQLQKRAPWFDSLYLWVPPQDLTRGGKHPEFARQPQRGMFLYPRYPATEDSETIYANLCIERAKALHAAGAPVEEVADAYIAGCQRQPTVVRAVATTEAASLLFTDGRYSAALGALTASGLSPELPLEAGIDAGLAPHRLVINRTQRAQILLALGREAEALAMLDRLGHEVIALDAPSASPVLSWIRWPVVAELRGRGQIRQARVLEERLQRAERRAQAWNEIRDKLLPRAAIRGAEPRFTYDQYETTPFLLYYAWLREGDLGVGLALDQPALLADLFEEMARFRDGLTIRDANGNYVAGAQGGGDIEVEVAFARTLTHLRVGVRASALDARRQGLLGQWLPPLLGVIVATIFGIAALYAQLRASVNQEQLLARQREFTTRVTHELKTPLAGIRVMAENLESGAFGTPEATRNASRQIMREADRLTRRIEEVLAVARERALPEPEPFDPEEVALICLDEWGPRMEAAGVVIEADFDATDEVKGDAEAVRDAVSCLLDNALKYADEAKEDRRVWFNLRQQGAEVCFEISDNGLGVPPAMREQIFERFVRVEGPNRGKSGGHGLGLAQVAAIAKDHQGRVRCEEGVDGGARFILSLPAHR